MNILEKTLAKKPHGFAYLFDPDKMLKYDRQAIQRQIEQSAIDFIFIGGSTLETDSFESSVAFFKAQNPNIPVVLFPGSEYQISEQADALLLLSLISGRNPDFLIGKHVKAASILSQSSLNIIPTGYILINGGKTSTVEQISRTEALSATDMEGIVNTALAGELLGMQAIYLEAGSGALSPISLEIIRAVKSKIRIPLIVGGGITNAQQGINACQSGADIIVVGNAIEQDLELMSKISNTIP